MTPSPLPLVVVGASAGGVEALSALVRGLPADLAAAVLVVLHVPSAGRSRLAPILDRSGPLPVAVAEHGRPLEAGTVVVAPSDQHLLVHGGEVRLSSGTKENGHRPAVDPLLRSAARWAGPRVVAVVLSGSLDDGAAGAAAVAQQGGAVVVQDPAEALFDSMPRAALRAVPDAVVLPVRGTWGHDWGPAAVREETPVPEPQREELTWETEMAELDEGAASGVAAPGRRVSLSCPSCHGAMNEVRTWGCGRPTGATSGTRTGPPPWCTPSRRSRSPRCGPRSASLEEQAAVHRELEDSAAEPAGATSTGAAPSRPATAPGCCGGSCGTRRTGTTAAPISRPPGLGNWRDRR